MAKPDQPFELADDAEMTARWELFEEFSRVAFESDYEPLFVADEATLYDVWFEDEEELIMQCFQYYGVRLKIEHFAWPLWRVFDYLYSTSIPYTMQVYKSAK